jgi:hypothetical protein
MVRKNAPAMIRRPKLDSKTPSWQKVVLPCRAGDLLELGVGKLAGEIIIRNGSETILRIRNNAANRSKLGRAAMRWASILGHRRRWVSQQMSRARVRGEAVKTMVALRLSNNQQQKIAASSVVEISIPYRGDPKVDGLPAMIPWEHLLTSVAKTRNADQPMVVVRHLRLSQKLRRNLSNSGARRSAMGMPQRFAFVGATPKRFLKVHEYAAEKDLVTSGLHPIDPVSIPANPTRQRIEMLMDSERPDVLHFSGVDTHLGEQILALRCIQKRR